VSGESSGVIVSGSILISSFIAGGHARLRRCHNPDVTTLTFLGTGNFHAPGRYWNSFLIDGRILVEPSPSVLANLRRAGIDTTAIAVVFASHFHADHVFGWPFLVVGYTLRARRSTPLWVVGPPGVEARFAEIVRAGALDTVVRQPDYPEIHYVDVDESPQEAGAVSFRAVRVEHVRYLECFGFLIECGDRVIGYSGDTTLCDGLRALASAADVLVLECNSAHKNPAHMDTESVRVLRDEFPSVPFVLTHVGDDVDPSGIGDVQMPDDFDTIEV